MFLILLLPIHQLELVLFNAKNYLTDDGKLFLVIHKDQGAKSLIRDLQKEYKVDVLEKNKGFFVIKCKKY